MRKIIFMLLILLVGVAIYANSLHGDFHLDDYPGIVANAGVKDLSNFTIDRLPFGTWTRYIPFFTFALNYHFHKLDVFGYHLFNLIIHLINALLTFWLFQLAAQVPALKNTIYEKYKDGLALLAALVFVAHPVQVQAVSYIYQRLASMATLWYLLTMCFYLKGRLAQKNRIYYFIASLVAALLGVFTKEIVFTLPAMVIMSELLLFSEDYDIKNLWRSVVQNRGVMIFLVVLVFIVLFIPFNYRMTPVDVVAQSSISHSHIGETVNFKNYIPTQMRVVVTYIRLLFLPIHQRFDYDFSMSQSFFELKVLLSMIALLTILIFAWRYRKKNVLASYGIFWFFIALCVESIFPIRNVIWEYRVYLPMVGFTFFLSGILAQLFKQKYLIIIAVVMVCILGFLTFQRNRIYNSEILVWKEAIKYNPQKSRPYNLLGATYINYGDYQRAIPYLKKALEYEPDDTMALFNLGQSMGHLGRYAEATQYVLRSYALEPSVALNPSMLAFLYYKQGDYLAAIDYYQKTLLLDGTEHMVESYVQVVRDYYDIHKDLQIAQDQILFLENMGIFSKEVDELKKYIKSEEMPPI